MTTQSLRLAHASRNPALEALIEALATRTARARLWRALSGTHLLAVQEFLRDHLQVAGMKPLAVS
jgi:hypothetical protein